MDSRSVYIVSARRTVLGRVGGLHRLRRIDDLCALPLTKALEDAAITPARVERLVLGNCLGGGNPARLVALTAGLPDATPALTIDQSGCSGLAAIVDAARSVALGEVEVAVAGGAESVSMAPWKIAKPRTLSHSPRFISQGLADDDGEADAVAAIETVAQRLRITRQQQDAYATRDHENAVRARDDRRFTREIAPFKQTVDETRDQSTADIEAGDFDDEPARLGEGTVTAANSSHPHDGAAIAVMVSPAVWDALGRPSAVRIIDWMSAGVSPAEALGAPLVAVRRLLARHKGVSAGDLDVIELAESSAVQAIAFRNALSIAEATLNPDGGAIARGHALGAAGAVLVARLFTRLARSTGPARARRGVAVANAADGQAVALLAEAV